MQDKNEIQSTPVSSDSNTNAPPAPGAGEPTNPANPEKPRRSIMQEVLSFGKEFLVALAVSFLITRFIFIIPLVPTGSMIPTIGIDERILVDKLSIWFSPIQRGQIVVFPCPDVPEELYIKRVIGLPGEKIEIHNETVYVNDVALEEPYLVVRTLGDFGPYYVPEGQIFVMGDNRNSSNDSRRWTTTSYVNLKEVQGRGVAVLWPFSNIRLLR